MKKCVKLVISKNLYFPNVVPTSTYSHQFTHDFVRHCPCTFLPSESSQWIFQLDDVTTAYRSGVSDIRWTSFRLPRILKAENGFQIVYWRKCWLNGLLEKGSNLNVHGHTLGARGDAVGSGNALQDRRSRVLFPLESLTQSFRPYLALGLTQPLTEMSKGKGVPLQAWSGPEGSRKLRFPDFMRTATGWR